MTMHKILLPVTLPNAALRVVHQAAFLARHFRSEIILLHVVTPLSYPIGVLESGHELMARDLHSAVINRAQQELDQALRSELEGIAVRRLLLRGDPASAIAQTARDENVDLIAMSTHSHSVFYRLLLGSVTAKVLHHCHCPLWTDTHVGPPSTGPVAIRNVLCALDLSAHSHHTLSRGAQVAAEFGARLTLVHVTAGVQTYGPGGPHIIPEWKEALIGGASAEIAKLQRDVGTDAEVIIDSGNVLELLDRVVSQGKSDLLVIGHLPAGGHLGDNGAGYAIIRESHIPVLSV